LAWVVATGLILAGYVGSWYLALERAPAVDVTAVLVGGALVTALLGNFVQGVPLPDAIGLLLLGAGVAIIVTSRRRPALVV
jgi:drug/metabolite transporter (DMT)-like permease